MNTIKIGTLNTQNSKVNRGGGIKDGIDNTKILADHIESNGYYSFGTQELTRKFSNRLSNNLKTYKLYGDYRYGSSRFVTSVKSLDSFNENNAVITNKKVIMEDTISLPWFPTNPKDLFISLKDASIMARIATVVEILDKDLGNLVHINTHLDYRLKNIQTKQLKEIYKIVRSLIKIEYKSLKYTTIKPFVIITGDFNMEAGVDNNFDEFIKALGKIGLKRVEVNTKTNSSKFINQSAIDHIFIPNTWDIEDAGLISDDELYKITDHKGVYAKVKVK